MDASLTSAFVGAVTAVVCISTVAVDDRATRGERYVRVGFYFLWSIIIALVVPEAWGWQRPLALSLTGSLGLITGLMAGGPIDRWLMRHDWPKLDVRSQQWQQEESAPNTAKRSERSLENGRIPLGSSTAYSGTQSSEDLKQSDGGKSIPTSSG